MLVDPAQAKAANNRARKFERAGEDDGDDFHVAMRMGWKTAAARHPILVDHTQAAEVRVLRVVVVREGKGVITVEPAVIGVAAFFGFAQVNHSDKEALRESRVNGARMNSPAREVCAHTETDL